MGIKQYIQWIIDHLNLRIIKIGWILRAFKINDLSTAANGNIKT